MTESFDIIQAINEHLASKERYPLKSAFKFYKRTLGPQFETVMRQGYALHKGLFYKQIESVRQHDIYSYSLRSKARALGYSLDEIKKLKPDELHSIVLERTRKAINPDKVQEQIDKPKLEDTKVRHKTETLRQQNTTQQPAKRMDQQSRRKAAARQARPVKDTNLDSIQPKTNTQTDRKENNKQAEKLARQEQVRTTAKKKIESNTIPDEGLRATERTVQETASKVKESAGRIGKKTQRTATNVKQTQFDDFGPKGGGWKLFEKDVKGAYHHTSRFFNKLTKESKIGKTAADLFKKSWARKVAGSIAITLAVNLGIGAIRHSFFPKPVIPDEYERGYDIMDEYLTDFGSPLNLAKSTHKILRPYYSTPRSSFKTTVNSVIDRNGALRAHKNAIGHTRY